MTIDEVRKYWDRRPCNLRHSSIRLEDDPLGYSQRVTERKYKVEPHIPAFAGFECYKGLRVLELGCGIGTDTLSFARAGALVTAIDISRESLRIAYRRAMAEGFDPLFLLGTKFQTVPSFQRVTFICGDIEELQIPLAWDRYDLVYSFGVLHHTPHPGRALQFAHLYLKPSGRLKVMLYHRNSTKVARILAHHPLSLLKHVPVDEIVRLESEAQQGSPISRTYTRDEGIRLLQRYGFAPIFCGVDHIFPYQIEAYTQHRYVRAFPWNLIRGQLFKNLEHRYGWHLLLEAKRI